VTKKKQSLVVKKSNSLIDASFQLNLNETRLLLCCAAQIRPKQKPDEMYFIDAKLFSELFDLEIDGVYKAMRTAMNRLGERWATVPDDNGHPKEIRWIITKQYFEKRGTVGLAFHPDMLPYISELHKHFTQYDIKHISKMKSNYGPYFYELLTKRRDLRKQYFSLEFIRTKFALGNKYEVWKDLRRNVIEPAINDINCEGGEFTASYKPIKEGRSVVGIEVTYSPRHKSLPLLDQEGKPVVETPVQAEWEKYRYRSAAEYREALELAEKYNFDPTDINAYLKAKIEHSRKS